MCWSCNIHLDDVSARRMERSAPIGIPGKNMDVSMCTVHAGTKWSTSHAWYKFVYSVTILCTLLKTRHCQSGHAQLSQMDGVSDVIFGHQLVASTGEHDSIRERLSSAEIMTHVSLGSGGMKLL